MVAYLFGNAFQRNELTRVWFAGSCACCANAARAAVLFLAVLSVRDGLTIVRATPTSI